MTYQVLARKWRPRDFASLVGQDHVVRALTHALDQQRLHHAYLFTGTRGVGKTTLSRILAKALNCETGITSQPCGVCRACREIDAGRFVDYVEMDAASNRGVDEMAALLERAIYAPVDARFKVYMIDEVHMLTNHAFNAMLKTLEEPPAHVKFILATTDPQKIPVTVLSRCLQFNLKQMPASDIVTHLDKVLSAEGIAFESQALRLLSRAADGSMRDALSLTDQAIAYAAGEVNEDAVRGMLGALDQHYLMRLLDSIVATDGAAVLAIADEMASRSLSFSIALQDLAQWLNRIGWAQFAPASVLDEWPEADDIRRFAQMLTPEQVQLYYQIATIGRSELGLAPDEYAGFTMTLLRMLAFRPNTFASGPDGTGARQPESQAGGPAQPMRAATSSVMSKASASPVKTSPPLAAPTPPATPSITPTPASPSTPASSVSGVAMSAAQISSPTSAAPRVQGGADDVLVATDDDEQDRLMIDAFSSSSVSPPSPASLASAAPMAVPLPRPALAVDSDAAANIGAIQPTSASASASAPTVRSHSPARAALEVLGTLGASQSGTTLARRGDPATPAAASPVGRPERHQAASTHASSHASAGLPADMRQNRQSGPAASAMLRPSVDGDSVDSDIGAADDSGDEMPPWASAPWDDDGADVFLSSARASLSPGATAPAVPSLAEARVAAKVADAPPRAYAPPATPATEPVSSAPDAGTLPAAIGLDVIGFDGDWPALAAQLDVRGLAQQLAFQSELTAADAQRLALRIPVAQLASGAHVDKVVVALEERLGRKVTLQIDIGPAQRTAAALEAARRAERQRRAEASIDNDAFVQALLRDFDAAILPGATQPLARGTAPAA